MSPRAYPLVGHLPSFLRDKLGFLRRCLAAPADCYQLHIGGPVLLLNHPEDVRHVLVANWDNYRKSPRIVSPRGKQLFGETLASTETTDHLDSRRPLAPFFTAQAVERFAGVIRSCTEQMLEGWADGARLDIHQEMTALTQRIIGQILFSVDLLGSEAELGTAFRARRSYIQHRFDTLLPLAEHLPLPINRAFRKAMQVIEACLDEMIQQRRAHPDRFGDLLALLVKANPVDRRVRDDAINLAVAGYETLADALSWTWLLLAEHPQTRHELHEEVDTVLQDQPPEAADVPRLELLERVLAESMRIYPPTWLFVRIAEGPDVLPSGVPVAAGTKIYLSSYTMHRNPRWFPNPDLFDPDRFTATAVAGRPKLAYFPFGGGPRICLGQALARLEAVLVVAQVAQQFELHVLPGQRIVPVPGITLRPRDGIHVQLRRRRLSLSTLAYDHCGSTKIRS